LEGRILEFVHKLRAEMIRNVPVQMRMAAFRTGSRRERWVGGGKFIYWRTVIKNGPDKGEVER